MTIPAYLKTFREAVRELGERDKRDVSDKSPSLMSHTSLMSHLPAAANCTEPSFPYAGALDALERRCPDYVEPDRWQQCVEDAQRFLATWGDKAEALGWHPNELFGLHTPPEQPHPTYSRLSRHDCTGLLWGLEGRRVIAMSSNSAAVETSSGALVHRKHDKPGL